MIESEHALWRDRLASGLPEDRDHDEDFNGPVLVSEMSFLRDAGVPESRLTEVSASLEAAGRSVKAVKSALRKESDIGPKALRAVTATWSQVIATPSDAALARDHFRKLARATAMLHSMRTRMTRR